MDVLNEYIKATNTHNFDEVKKYLHPNAIYFFSNKTCTTHDDIQDYFINAWEVVKNENYEAHDEKHSNGCFFNANKIFELGLC